MGAHSQNIRGPTVITNLGVHSFDFSGGPQSKGVVGHSRGGPPSSSQHTSHKVVEISIETSVEGSLNYTSYL